MPFCPKCREEFQDWVKVCPKCKVELIHKMQPLPKPEPAPKPVNKRLPDEKIVTIARFSHPEEAFLAVAKLESEGIRSFLADVNTVTANWLWSNAIGQVRLQVRESEAAEAKRILSLPQVDIQTAASPDEICPKCNSADIKYETFALRPIFILWALTSLMSFGAGEGGFTLPFLKKKWRCNTCGHQWKNPS